MKMQPTILTVSGVYFNFLEPQACDVRIEDIAHALSHVCRFAGHTKTFYSVAQHSVLVSLIVPEECALAGLMHDAAEAYLGDVTSPLKALLPDYKRIEDRVERAIFERFGLAYPPGEAIKVADRTLLSTEKRDLMYRDAEIWSQLGRTAPLDEVIVPMTPDQAKAAFLERFETLQLDGVKQPWGEIARQAIETVVANQSRA